MANASLTINFSAKSDDDLTLDVDLDDVKNKDKTTFKFGDTAYFRIFTDATTIDIYESDGNVGSHGTGTTSEEDILVFEEPPGGVVDDNTADLSYIPSGPVSFQVIAGSAGAFSMDPDDPKKVLASQAGIAVVRASYNAEYLSKSIGGVNAPPGWPIDEDYPVVVVVVGT